MTLQQQRQTAYKISIGMLLNSEGNFTGERFDYLNIAGKKIGRVSIIANVVEKYISETKPYGALTIDDGTGQIRIKFFDKLEQMADVNVGDTILIIGVLRFFNEELYILPEIIKKLDVEWTLVRKLELEKEYGKEMLAHQFGEPPSSPTFKEGEHEEFFEKEIEEEKIEKAEEPNVKEEILKFVKQNEEGVDIDKVIMSLHYPVAEINTAITELIEEGRIYEPQPGRIRTI